MNHLIDSAFAKEWQIGGESVPCRYRYKDDAHELKNHSGLLEKGTLCVHPDGDKYEVISSERFNTSTYLHTLQPLNDKPQTDWTPQR
tara:strand:+ start:31257 stop:31517 length:261 start_codon:yes stop_codon:yes gene_type:complete